jgi:L-asparaginase II
MDGRSLQRRQRREARMDEFRQLIMQAESGKHIGIVCICTCQDFHASAIGISGQLQAMVIEIQVGLTRLPRPGIESASCIHRP